MKGQIYTGQNSEVCEWFPSPVTKMFTLACMDSSFQSWETASL